MNGIMPGPLWLAIASSANSSLTENRTLTYQSKNATVTGEMAENQEDNTTGSRNRHTDGKVILNLQKPEKKRHGG